MKDKKTLGFVGCRQWLGLAHITTLTYRNVRHLSVIR